MSEIGNVTAVEVIVVGSSLTDDAPAGATTLTVDDNSAFVAGKGVVLRFEDTTFTTTVASVPHPDAGDDTTLTITGPLPAAFPAYDTRVDVDPPEVVATAFVDTGIGGDALPCLIPHALQDALPEGIREARAMETATIGRDYDGRLVVLDVVGKKTVRDLTDAVGLPDLSPTEPPAATPAIFVTPMATGFMVSTEDIEGTTRLRYRIDGIGVREIRSTTEFLTQAGTGGPLLPGTDYSIDVVAFNDLGEAPPSAAFTGQLDPGVDPEFVRAIIRAGIVYAGAAKFGPISIDPEGGFELRLLDGRSIYFREGGSKIAGEAELDSATIQQLRLLGALNKVLGGVELSNGTAAPTVAPRVSQVWQLPALYQQAFNAQNLVGQLRGLYDNGTSWYTIEALFGGTVWAVPKNGDPRLPAASLPKNFNATSITKVNNVWRILGSDGNRNGRWFVYSYDLSWNKISEWEFAYADTGGGEPVVATDGTDLFIGRFAFPSAGSTTYRAIVRRFNLSGALLEPATVAAQSTPGTYAATGLYVGSANFGASRYVLTSPNTVYAISPVTGGRAFSQEWLPANGERIWGLAWDGTRFHTISQETGRIWRYSRVVTATPRQIRHTWHRAGTSYETEASPAKAWTQQPGQWMQVETDPPANGGANTDPDSIRVYVDDQRQAAPGAGVTSVVYDLPALGGAAAPTTNSFPVATTPAWLRSGATFNGRRLIWADGAGNFQALKDAQRSHETFDVQAAGTHRTRQVTFDVPFDVKPVVNLEYEIGSAPNSEVDCYPSNVTTTGFLINFVRRDAASGPTVHWSAGKPTQ